MGVRPQVKDEPVFVPGPDEHGDVDAVPVSLWVVDGHDSDGVGRVLVAEGGAGVIVLTHRPEKGPGAGALESVPQVGALALVLTRVAGRLDRSQGRRCLVALVLPIATGNYVHSLKKTRQRSC